MFTIIYRPKQYVFVIMLITMLVFEIIIFVTLFYACHFLVCQVENDETEVENSFETELEGKLLSAWYILLLFLYIHIVKNLSFNWKLKKSFLLDFLYDIFLAVHTLLFANI